MFNDILFDTDTVENIFHYEYDFSLINNSTIGYESEELEENIIIDDIMIDLINERDDLEG